MKEGLYFSYNGIYSKDMGLINVSVSSGMIEEQFLAEREINEVRIKGRDKPYFQGVSSNPLVLNLTFAFEDYYDEEKIRKVARWLCQDYYKPFYTTDSINRIYYCMYVGDPVLVHNGLKQGYFNMQLRCDSSYSHSPTYVSKVYDLSNNPSEGTIVDFVNNGDKNVCPEISLLKVGDGDISIFNQSNKNEEFKFTNLANNEDLYVDCENEIIKTNLDGIYRYSNFNDNFLELLYGRNKLLVKGNCKIQIRWKTVLLNG